MNRIHGTNVANRGPGASHSFAQLIQRGKFVRFESFTNRVNFERCGKFVRFVNRINFGGRAARSRLRQCGKVGAALLRIAHTLGNSGGS
jgi:hypothetical protein